MQRDLSGISSYDHQPMSFSDTVRQTRMFDATGMSPSFVGIGGSNAISSFEQFQHPPSAWFRPTVAQPAGQRTGMSFAGGLTSPLMDGPGAPLNQLNNNHFPYVADILKNQMLRM